MLIANRKATVAELRGDWCTDGVETSVRKFRHRPQHAGLNGRIAYKKPQMTLEQPQK